MKESTIMFLRSGLKEEDFYHLKMKNLITLKEFLEEYKSLDEEYQKFITKEVESIKNKCNWIEDVGFYSLQNDRNGMYINTGVRLFAKDDINLIANYNKITNKYEESNTQIPKLYLISKRIRTFLQRKEELSYIQNELCDIDEIGRAFYDGLLSANFSISGNFEMHYTPSVGMDVFSEDELLASYTDRRLKEYDKCYLSEEPKAKILSLIQLENKL